MIESLKYLPRKTIIQLFNEVFDQLPELLAEVAPDGWEHSAYYPLFHFSPEEEALRAMLNNLTRTQYQQRFGAQKYRNSAIVDLESLFKNLEFTLHPKPFYPEQELCSLFVEAISGMCHGGKFCLADSEYCYEVNPPVAHTAAQIVARDKGIVTKKPYRLPMIQWEKRILISEANLMPLMRYLFKALSNTDYKWEYLDYEVFDFIGYCNNYQSDDDSTQIPYYATKRDEELGITSIPKLEDYFTQASKELPSDPVVAYADVFGEWPKGFPPEKEHYLEWYKKYNPSK